MGNRSVLRRLKNLEKAFAIQSEEEWINVLMWNGVDGGVFGHVHCRFSKSGHKSELLPYSDEEEVEIMLEHYEKAERKIPGREEPVCFGDFLEHYSYLGPKKLANRRRQIIKGWRRQIIRG